MAILRVAKCDICDRTEIEETHGAGWVGWAIIQGIASVPPVKDKSLTTENTSMMLCPHHKMDVANFIEGLQEEI